MSMGTYYLLRHPEKVERLRRELATVPRNEIGLLEYKKVRDLPYLVCLSFCYIHIPPHECSAGLYTN